MLKIFFTCDFCACASFAFAAAATAAAAAVAFSCSRVNERIRNDTTTAAIQLLDDRRSGVSQVFRLRAGRLRCLERRMNCAFIACDICIYFVWRFFIYLFLFDGRV